MSVQRCDNPNCFCCGHTCDVPHGQPCAKGDVYVCPCGRTWTCTGTRTVRHRGHDYPATHWESVA